MDKRMGLFRSRDRLERLRSPGVPVDGIVSVLKEIGTGFVDQSI